MFFRPSAASLEIQICPVNSLNFLVKSAKFLPVIDGNTSLKASLKGLRIINTLANALYKLCIKSVLPPNSFQSFRTEFLASAERPAKKSNTCPMPVNNCVASSILPTIFSQVVAHPD